MLSIFDSFLHGARDFRRGRSRATAHGVTTTIKEKPSKGTTLLSYGLLLCAGIFAWSVFTKDEDAAEKPAEVARVEPSAVAPAEPSPAPVVEPEKPKTRKGFKISAATLIAAYEANEVAADEKFKGKLIEVTGVIDSIAKDILGDPYLTLGSGKDFEIAHVQAMFPASAAKQLAGLRKGQTITVQCDCAGKVMNVIGKDCGVKPASVE
jgi:hypothetical protein